MNIKQKNINARVSLRDVATELGLAVTTVSDILTREKASRYNPETVQRVKEAARRMKYQPNLQAQFLKKRRARAISFVFFSSNPHFRAPVTSGEVETVIVNLEERLHAHDYHTFYQSVGYQPEEYDKLILSGRSDGHILFSYGPADFVRRANELGQPVVVVNGTAEGGQALSLLYDDARGAEDVVAYLVGLGHRDIGYFTDMSKQTRHYSYTDRLEGVRRGMAAAGLAERLTEFRAMTVADMLNRFPALPRRPTAILFHNHYRAIEAQRLCWERGIRVPADVSLMAFNDCYPTHMLTPAMSTVSLPSEPLIERVFSALMGALEGGGDGVVDGREVYREELVIRESTVRVP